MTRRWMAAGRLLATATALALAGCAPITVTSYTGRGIDVTSYRTFAWERIDTAVPGDPRLDNNPFFHEYLRDAIELQLISRGYEPTTLGPGLRVHYHTSAHQRVYKGRGSAKTETCLDCSVEVYDESTVTIDLTDARTGALVWRGVAETDLGGAVADQTRMERTLDRLVERVFAALPRRS